MSHRVPTLVLAGVLVTVLVGGCSTAPPHRTPPRRPAPQPTASTGTLTPKDTVKTATPRQVIGLVRIVANIGAAGETSTGMVLSRDGRVVTNNHGVGGATVVRATVMSTGRTYDARVVAADKHRDVAVLDLAGATGLRTVILASHDVTVGDRVTVVGDAQGRADRFTAATGRVLGVNQNLVARPERLRGLLYFSADVRGGESGGPTYGSGGRVVGMTTASIPRPYGVDGVAIPVDALRAAVRDLTR